ncbi:MAG: hypothetical protein AB8G05_26605 [Oligoflexales bacterium]
MIPSRFLEFIGTASIISILLYSSNNALAELHPPKNKGRAYYHKLPDEYIKNGKFDTESLEKRYRINFAEGGNAKVKVRLAPRARNDHDNSLISSLPPLFLHQVNRELLNITHNQVGQSVKNADFENKEIFLYMPKFLVNLKENDSETIFSREEIDILIQLRNMIMPAFSCYQAKNNSQERSFSSAQTFCSSRSPVNLPDGGKQWGIPQIPYGNIIGENTKGGVTEEGHMEFTFAKTNALVNNFDDEQKEFFHRTKEMLNQKMAVTSQDENNLVEKLAHFLSHFYDGSFVYVYNRSKTRFNETSVYRGVVGSCVLSPFPSKRVESHLPLVTDFPVELPEGSLPVLDTAPVTIPAVAQLSAKKILSETGIFGMSGEQSYDMPSSRHQHYGLLGQGYAIVIEQEDFNPQSYNNTVEIVMLTPSCDCYGAFIYFPKSTGGTIIAHPFVEKMSEEGDWEQE